MTYKQAQKFVELTDLIDALKEDIAGLKFEMAGARQYLKSPGAAIDVDMFDQCTVTLAENKEDLAVMEKQLVKEKAKLAKLNAEIKKSK